MSHTNDNCQNDNCQNDNCHMHLYGHPVGSNYDRPEASDMKSSDFCF